MPSSNKLFLMAGLVSVLLVGTPAAEADWIGSGTVTIYDSSPDVGGDYAVAAMLDGNLATYSKQIDDVDTDVAPYTGYVIFDLGGKQQVDGFKFWSRDHATADVNPKDIDFFYWADEDLNAHKFTPNTSDQIALDGNVVVAANRLLPGVHGNASYEVSFTSGEVFTARYVGLRYNDSWDTPANVANQFAEVQFHAIPEPSAMILWATGVIGLLCYVWKKRS